MPKVRRASLPPALLEHLLDRVQARSVTWQEIEQLSAWLDQSPGVPEGEWVKELGSLVVCGRGELIRTFLRKGQAARGKRI